MVQVASSTGVKNLYPLLIPQNKFYKTSSYDLRAVWVGLRASAVCKCCSASLRFFCKSSRRPTCKLSSQLSGLRDQASRYFWRALWSEVSSSETPALLSWNKLKKKKKNVPNKSKSCFCSSALSCKLKPLILHAQAPGSRIKHYC